MSGNSTNGQCDMRGFALYAGPTLPLAIPHACSFVPRNLHQQQPLDTHSGSPLPDRLSGTPPARRPAAAGDRAAGDRQMQAHSAVSSAGLRA
jgi:hypothetical protein